MLENYLPFLEHGESIDCPECIQRREQDNALGKGLRAPGQLRPNILLYNTACTAAEEIADLAMKDTRSLHKNHVLLIGGTTLQILGIKSIIQTFNDAMFGKNLPGCQIIYVDITGNSPSVLPENTVHVQMDCQQFAVNAISKLQHRISDENEQSEKHRRDFRPFWD
jgi:NAD-dependent SIR2 family protein deacetylase